MNFKANLRKIFKKSVWGLAALSLFFGTAGAVVAQIAPSAPTTDPTSPSDTPPTSPGTSTGGGASTTAAGGNLVEGDVYGFGWMGTEISNPGSSEGGGGWLKFNCGPSGCGHGSNWGVRVDLDENSSQYGYFSGEAWSNNYGWMTFAPDLVSECWEAAPGETANDVAHILFPAGKVVGWAKFVNGDDVDDDGYTGCVSFSGANYGVYADVDTGILRGWAWGSDVVGWISFQNPECPFCDPTIVVETAPDILFWADQYSVPFGGGTTLRWSANNTSTATVVSCPSYDNTNGYNHWESNQFFPSGSNVGLINVGVGNLPIGQHPISGINETTTYELTCKDSNGEDLQTKYLTIVAGPRVMGCMDPIATNYNPNANVPGRCTYGPPVVGCMDPVALNYNPLATAPGRCDYGPTALPTVDLQLITNFPPNFLPVGSPQSTEYNVSPRWTFTNPTQVGTPWCTGQFYDHNGTEQNLFAWTGADLDRPSAPSWSVGPYPSVTNVASFAAAPGVVNGSQFTYKINCTDINGNIFSDSAVVIFRDDDRPSTPPNLSLQVSPEAFVLGSGNYNVGPITWSSNNPSLIQPGSCSGLITKNNSPVITLTGWTGPRTAPTVATPSLTINGPLSLASQVSGMTDGEWFRFAIVCQTTAGSQISATDAIFLTAPSTPASGLLLTIESPNSALSPSANFEIIPQAGFDPVVLDWSSAQTHDIDWATCSGTSQLLNPDGTLSGFTNATWENATEYNQSGGGSGQTNVNMTGQNNMTSWFTLTCDGLDGVTRTSSVLVCKDGADNLCPRTSGPVRPPGYKEI